MVTLSFCHFISCAALPSSLLASKPPRMLDSLPAAVDVKICSPFSPPFFPHPVLHNGSVHTHTFSPSHYPSRSTHLPAFEAPTGAKPVGHASRRDPSLYRRHQHHERTSVRSSHTGSASPISLTQTHNTAQATMALNYCSVLRYAQTLGQHVTVAQDVYSCLCLSLSWYALFHRLP